MKMFSVQRQMRRLPTDEIGFFNKTYLTIKFCYWKILSLKVLKLMSLDEI